MELFSWIAALVRLSTLFSTSRFIRCNLVLLQNAFGFACYALVVPQYPVNFMWTREIHTHTQEISLIVIVIIINIRLNVVTITCFAFQFNTERTTRCQRTRTMQLRIIRVSNLYALRKRFIISQNIYTSIWCASGFYYLFPTFLSLGIVSFSVYSASFQWSNGGVCVLSVSKVVHYVSMMYDVVFV